MAATLELLQKLQRQRVRMGELGDASPPETPAQATEGTTEDDSAVQMLNRSSSSCEDESQGELQLKLKRQRRRMGEFGLPLQEISNQELEEQAAAAVCIDGDVKVRQRALKFEGFEHSLPSRPQLPGRVNLERWEPMQRTCAATKEEEETEGLSRYKQWLQEKELLDVTLEQQQLSEGAQKQNQQHDEDRERQLQEDGQEQNQQHDEDLERQRQAIQLPKWQPQQQLEEYEEQPQYEDDQDHLEEQGKQHFQFQNLQAYLGLEAVLESPEEELSMTQKEELDETILEEELSRIQTEQLSETSRLASEHESDKVDTEMEQLGQNNAEETFSDSQEQRDTSSSHYLSAEGNDQERLMDALHDRQCFTAKDDAPGFKWSSIRPESDDEQNTELPETSCEQAQKARPADLSSGDDVHAKAQMVNPTDYEDRPFEALPLDANANEQVHAEEAQFPAQAAQCYSLADGDDDIPEQDDWEEPLEFAMLDYCGSLPEGVVHKLRDALKLHEDLLRKLDKRNKLLRSRVREIRKPNDAAPDPALFGGDPAAPASPKLRPSTPPKRRHRCPTSPQSRPLSPCSPALSNASPFQLQRTVANASVAAAEARRQRLLRAEMSSKVEAINTERARQRDAQAEANLRARLQGTMKASKEQILTMQRRAEQEEERMRMRFEMAMRTRDGLEGSLKAVLREQEQTKQQIAQLEDWFISNEHTNKGENKERIQAKHQEKKLTSELKAHRARAQRCLQRQRRTNDMIKELESLKTGFQKFIE